MRAEICLFGSYMELAQNCSVLSHDVGSKFGILTLYHESLLSPQEFRFNAMSQVMGSLHKEWYKKAVEHRFVDFQKKLVHLFDKFLNLEVRSPQNIPPSACVQIIPTKFNLHIFPSCSSPRILTPMTEL